MHLALQYILPVLLYSVQPYIHRHKLASTPKYNLLYQAFGWNIPNYIHCPPVMKDAQNKLSKRNGDASYQDLVAKGYLTEAILNYICLLGWSPKGEYAEQEIFSLADLVRIWTPDGISKSPAIFDPLKLRAINADVYKRQIFRSTRGGICELLLLR